MTRILACLAAFGIARADGPAQGLPLRTATAGAYFARLQGSHAIRLNPAGIAYRALPADSLAEGPATAPFTLTLLSVSAVAANNAIDTHWLNNQLYAGLDLREPGSKERFLSVFPSGLWRVNMAADVRSLVLTRGNWGLALLGYEGAAAWDIPADLIDVVFRGVRFDQPKDLSAIEIMSHRMAPISLAYGREVGAGSRTAAIRRWYLGAGANLHLGMDRYRLQTDYLQILSTADSLQIRGQTVVHSTDRPAGSRAAIKGVGLSFDIGIIAETRGGLTLSFALKDLLGRMVWRNSYVTLNRFTLNFRARESGNILADYSDALSAFEEMLAQPDSSYTVTATTYPLPVLLMVGGSYALTPRLVIDAAGQRVLRQGDIPANGPAISLGLQYSPQKRLPLYAGVGLGESARFSWGAGFALHIRRLQWSFGFGQSDGIFNGAKGASLSTELRLVR